MRLPPRRGGTAALLVAVWLGVSCAGEEARATEGSSGRPARAEVASELRAGFDYPGGWRDESSCVDICGVTPGSPVERPRAVVCFDPDDEACAAKTGIDDYDYLLLSQHWLPSFCAGLAAGYDTTLTHREEARCRAGTPSRLAIHGLWPNYDAGFPQCCGEALPLEPEAARRWPAELRQRLDREWPDPTTHGFDVAICEILDHEWQKHGTCMAEATDEGARRYFTAGLEIARQVASSTRTIDGWAGTTRSTAEIRRLYPKSVQVLCDAARPEHLLEIRTCWSRDREPVDCSPGRAGRHSTPCGDRATLPIFGS